jgi:hypothetical protein
MLSTKAVMRKHSHLPAFIFISLQIPKMCLIIRIVFPEESNPKVNIVIFRIQFFGNIMLT